ncbi:MAG: 4-hydroxy-3-methylbut-2-enyl diphosphate reductase [Isosphaeraceae bacterium]|nr:4-hydroxy-3-methylbut-2-enyl diphosphate reductase [Isosphaeraceae bacterium]
MRVIRADVLGMCFGVRDALAVLDRIEQPGEVTILGELVHNEAVLVQLGRRGFPMVKEAEREALPTTPAVLITAHGVSDRERRRLEGAGKRLIDTTCPLVVRVHRAAQELRREGYHVLLIGRRGHVEVRGVVEDLDSVEVIERPDEVVRYPHDRLGIICQTTATERNVRAICEAVVRLNPQAEVRFIDTVCRPTKEHQRALEELIGQVDAMVVIGGRNSNNTRELVARCRERGRPALHIQGAADLDPSWFAGVEVVGLTAGTSTLAETIDEVHQALLDMASEPLG